MLDTLRQQSQKPAGRFFLAFLFGLLAISFFIAFGPSGRLFEPVKSDFAAKVNGEIITRNDFERYYYRQVRQFGSVDPTMLNRIMPRSRVLDELIKDRLVAEYATEEGIDVSDADLRDVIVKDPSFEDESGKFSAERYKLVIERSLGMSVDVFEDEMRRQLRAQKVAALLRETAKVPEADLRRSYADENEKVNLRYVRFSPAFYTNDVQVSDDEIKALLKDHMDQVQAAYQKQTSMYHTGKQVQARHILIKVPSGKPDADEVAKGRLAKLKADVEKGADFAALAKSQSQAGDASIGGELGLVKQGSHAFDPAIEGAALGLEEGKVSDPVHGKQGWEIVQAEKILPAQDHPLEEVKEAVARDVIVRDRAIAKAQAVASAAEQAMTGGKSLAELFPAAPPSDPTSIANPTPDHPVSDTTGLFARSAMGFVPKIGPAAGLQKIAFDLQTTGDAPKPMAGPTRVGDAFVVAELVEHQKADMAQFDQQKDELRENQLRTIERQLLQALRTKLRSKAVVEVNGSVLGPQTSDEG